MLFSKKSLFLFTALTILTLSFSACTQDNSNKNTSKKESIAPEVTFNIEKKSAVYGDDFMVSSANPLATQAGVEMLKQGGSAIDAAVAVQMMLNLVEPQSSGIGGGGFLLYYDAKSKKLTTLDGREVAPKSAKADMFINKEGNPLSYKEALRGGRAVGIPGVLKLLYEAHSKYGKIPWKSLFAPAIHSAAEGFPFSKRLRSSIQEIPHYSELASGYKRYLDKEGNLLPEETLIRNEDLAKTFQTIANQGIKPFYEGKLADIMIETVESSPEAPVRWTKEDLAGYTVKTRSNICASYNEYKICSMSPPSSGGATILQALKILEPFKLREMPKFSAQAYHLIAEASRLAFADRNKYLADPDFINVPIKQMLNDEYLAKRSKLININSSISEAKAGSPVKNVAAFAPSEKKEGPSTTHMSIIDKNGNAVSMTSSIEYAFGSGLETSAGFILNNQLTDFDFIPEKNGARVANSVQAGKRPRSSMSPTMVFDKQGNLKLVIGSPGGARIIGYVLKALVHVLDWNQPLQKALDSPNVISMSKYPDIELEDSKDWKSEKKILEEKGYKVRIRNLNSGLHAVQITKDGKLIGAADPRREGIAVGM